jgi:hypothetical protein
MLVSIFYSSGALLSSLLLLEWWLLLDRLCYFSEECSDFDFSEGLAIERLNCYPTMLLLYSDPGCKDSLMLMLSGFSPLLSNCNLFGWPLHLPLSMRTYNISNTF